MSLPRQILRGTSYLVTRRTARRQFFLKPSPEVNQIFLYCLAYATMRTGMWVHAFCVMSNHHHVVLTDPEGRLPEFTALLHRLVACCLKCLLNIEENVWSNEQASHVALQGNEDVLDKYYYTLCNSVNALLVPKSSDWPGLCSSPGDLLRGEIEVERPDVFFGERSKMPKKVKLRLVRPKIYFGLTDKQLVETLEQGLEEREDQIRAEAKRQKKEFMGVRRILSQKPFDRPSTPKKSGEINPQIAAKNKWRRIEALRRLRSWHQAYREAWNEWKTGKRDVEFPPGTYALVRHAGAKCVKLDEFCFEEFCFGANG